MKPQSKGRTWIWLIVLLILFLTISYFSFSSKPQVYPSYVTDSPSPTGVKAVYTYLKKELNVTIWTKPPELLPKNGEKKLLIMVEPSFLTNKAEEQKYVSFMEEGNTILLLKDNPKGMFDIETLFIEENIPSPTHDKDNKVVKSLINSQYRLQSTKQDQILIQDNLGPIALSHPYGKGKMIVSVTPEWITNENILKLSNLTQVLNLIEEGKTNVILFDEYIHGGKNASSMLTIYPMWFLLFILQGGVLILLWLWLNGKRFGPIFIPREESVRFSDEGIQAIAAWYLRGKRYHDSLLLQADYVKVMVHERWRIPYNQEWQEFSSYFEKKWLQISDSEIKSFLSGLVVILEKEKLNKQEYLEWSRKLEQLRKEVEA